MRVLQVPAPIISSVIGDQKIYDTLNYRLLNFCVLLNENGVYLLYNNLTKEFLELEKKEYEIIKSRNFDKSDSFIVYLINKWFLVPEDQDDVKLSLQIRDFARLLKPKDVVDLFNIVTTTACNARCFYCFEAGARATTMTPQIATDVAHYLINKAKGNLIKIGWFGGEPLCNYPAIDKISEILRENGAQFTSIITTNGYLIDDKIIEKAKNKWNLRFAQITLDGMQDSYNRIKNYVTKDENPFARVISNIKLLLDADIAVSIRLNVSEENLSEMYELVDYLHSLYGQFDKLGIYCRLLFENAGHEKFEYGEKLPELSKKFLNLCKYVEDKGLKFDKNGLSRDVKTYFCLADDPHGQLISPEGKIGNCERYVDGEFPGDIYSDPPTPIWNTYCDLEEKCKTCVFYPTCLRIKECPNCVHGCYPYEQAQNLMALKNQMRQAYENLK